MYQEYENFRYNPPLAPGEAVLWRGKPKKSAFIASHSLTMLPIAAIWLILDLSFLSGMFFSGTLSLFTTLFFILHLLPVWIWLGSTLTAGKRWHNTMYYVTNRRIIVRGGFLAVNEKSVFYKDIRNAQLKIGFFDKIAGTGSVVLDDGHYDYHRRRNYPGTKLEHLEDAKSAYALIQKTILDIQTDMEYPNAYRPAQNPGYQTDYRP